MKNYSKLNEVIRISGHLGPEKVRWGPWKPEFWRQPLFTNLDPVFGRGSRGRLSHRRGPRTCVWAFRGPCLTQVSLEGVGQKKHSCQDDSHPLADQRVSETDPAFPEPR